MCPVDRVHAETGVAAGQPHRGRVGHGQDDVRPLRPDRLLDDPPQPRLGVDDRDKRGELHRKRRPAGDTTHRRHGEGDPVRGERDSRAQHRSCRIRQVGNLGPRAGVRRGLVVTSSAVGLLYDPLGNRRQFTRPRVRLAKTDQDPSQRRVDPGPQHSGLALQFLFQQPATRRCRQPAGTAHPETGAGTGQPVIAGGGGLHPLQQRSGHRHQPHVTQEASFGQNTSRPRQGTRQVHRRTSSSVSSITGRPKSITGRPDARTATVAAGTAGRTAGHGRAAHPPPAGTRQAPTRQPVPGSRCRLTGARMPWQVLGYPPTGERVRHEHFTERQNIDTKHTVHLREIFWNRFRDLLFT